MAKGTFIISSVFSAIVSSSSLSYLGGSKISICWLAMSVIMLFLNARTSSSVSVSDLAITGIKLTFLWSFFITVTSRALRE